MENHYNCIYMYTNKINGKRYVGKAKDFLIRKRQHINSSYNKNAKDYNYIIHKAIRKYGIESFEIIILRENIPLCLLSFYEDYYADKYNVYTKNGDGYNTAKCGGGGDMRYGKTEEEIKQWRQKISDNHDNVSGENNPMYGKTGENSPLYGKPRSELTKQKISEALKGKEFSEEHKQNLSKAKMGKPHTEETKQKMSETRKEKQLAKGKNNPQAKRVVQYDLGGNLIRIWDYAKQVTEELGIDNSNIIKCCRGKQKSAGGFVWKYADEIE